MGLEVSYACKNPLRIGGVVVVMVVAVVVMVVAAVAVAAATVAVSAAVAVAHSQVPEELGIKGTVSNGSFKYRPECEYQIRGIGVDYTRGLHVQYGSPIMHASRFAGFATGIRWDIIREALRLTR